ncbi:MAG: bifunctional (p)ppGpp synthetase/guanosine-3',5'-bis(diphosphate) 3'-pyrophosphohydrolase [Myxococcales bacterium]|nr:bifunctional (p)ppGpp synthetase/guanosine-3',5'-bis(diphosphate) 3'-pyrophosphohydrolase [Myxococcales bacterium]
MTGAAAREREVDDDPLVTAFARVLEAVRARDADADVELISRAFEVAVRAHTGQVRRSGEPYLIHPIRVSETIARLGLDTHSVAAGLLHDSVEDSELTVVDITETFDAELAGIVDGVTKLGKVPYLSRQEQQAESFRKMLLAMSQDIRVLLVKLADRLDNMRTLDHMPAEKQARISRETMEIYAPLANRLGIQWIRAELQNLSFRYLEPAIYERIADKMTGLLADSEAKIEACVERVALAFAAPEGGEPGDDDGVMIWPRERGEVRVRSSVRVPFQVYQMESEDGHEVDTLADLVSYHVIVPDRASCYAALGVIHSHFKPVPDKVRDYIALPRPNRYQALHTMVIARDGVRMEIQIRSAAMDAVADRGIVAEWQREHAIDRGPEGWRNLKWLGELMDWQGDVSDPHEFIESVKADLFADEVYVFSPGGDIFTFRRGATPIDFAYAIHTDVGDRCSGARVNGHLVPLRYQLRQGDTIEIITSPTARPRREWLKMCGSSRARAKIKQHLRVEERTRLREVGRSLLEQDLASRGERLAELESQGRIAQNAPALDLGKELRGEDGVYEAIGAGLISVARVVERLAPSAADEEAESDSTFFRRVFRRVSGRRNGGRPGASAWPDLGPKEGVAGSPIIVNRERCESHGAGSPMIQLATCCGPIPGDPLVGYFVPGKGIVAHVEGCPESLEHIDERRVYLAWEDGLEIDSPVTIEVRTGNTVGLLAEMSRAFSYHGVNIKQANCRTIEAGMRAVNTFHATVRTLAQLKSLMMTLREIDGVLGVQRVFVGTSGFAQR